MTVRETYMKDYLITDCRKKELVQFCRNADNEDLIMILQAAIQSNPGLASKLWKKSKNRKKLNGTKTESNGLLIIATI